MKILHLCTARRGGAGIAASRLNNGLLNEGVESILFSREDLKDIPYRGINGICRRLRDSINYRASLKCQLAPEILHSLTVCFDIRTFIGEEYFSQFPEADIINLHWISDFFNYKDFFKRYAVKKPLVWTLHDKNAFMGGCHYQHDTDILTRLTGRGMPLNCAERKDIDHKIWYLKKMIYDAIPPSGLTIITPSRWLQSEAKNSELLSKFKILNIPNGIDVEIFSPKEKNAARKIFDIPEQAKVILFCAASTDNKYKGFHILLDALKKTTGEYYLIALGNKEIADQIKHIYYLGSFSNEKVMAAIYSAADVFVTPTLEDNFPNTILESFACGTPVIGSNVGGIPETVRNGITGLLFETGNADDLADKIDKYFSDKLMITAMSKACRNIAVTEYALPLQAQKYKKLYEELLED